MAMRTLFLLTSCLSVAAQDLFLQSKVTGPVPASSQHLLTAPALISWPVSPSAAVSTALAAKDFPNFPCTEDGANKLMAKYQMARIDSKNGPTEISQLLSDDATYTIPILGTYKGKQAVINDYMKKNAAVPGYNYRNDVLRPAKVVVPGAAAEGAMKFDAWKMWWHNGLTATSSLKCAGNRWMIQKIVVA